MSHNGSLERGLSLQPSFEFLLFVLGVEVSVMLPSFLSCTNQAFEVDNGCLKGVLAMLGRLFHILA